MAGASIEGTLELWASSLRDVKARLRALFRQERVAASAWKFLDGLLGNEPRKTGWMRAEAAGDPGPWRQQAILGRMDWDADALRDIVGDYVIEHLADDDAVLVIDETGFLKQGKASCGVARQYTGSAGKITNCQIGVFAGLRFAPRSCVHRSRAVSSEGMDRRSRSPGSRIRAPRCRLCDQTTACDENDCTRHRRICTIQVGGRRYCLRCWRYRTATTPGRQRLCTRGQQRSCIPILGQAAIGRRQGRGHRPDAALVRLETPVGRGRNQRLSLIHISEPTRRTPI